MRYLRIALLAVLSNLCFSLKGQQTVSFPAEDGLEVTADLYFQSFSYPYIILLHQAGYSRGEYREIAPKLVNLGFNCLAVDLRSGNRVNGVINQTALRAKSKGIPTGYLDAVNDISGAISYVKEQTTAPFVLWGSSYSASLALMVGAKNLRTGAIIAFSPGEYFDKPDTLRSSIGRISVPTLILSAKSECAITQTIASVINQNLVTRFCPDTPGKHGAKALWKSNPNHNDYWLSLALFFSRVSPTLKKR